MKCHYCKDREAVTTVGDYVKRDVCALCAEARKVAGDYVDSIFTPPVLERIFGGAKPKQKH